MRVWEQGWWEGKGYWWDVEGVGAGLVGGEGVLMGRRECGSGRGRECGGKVRMWEQ